MRLVPLLLSSLLIACAGGQDPGALSPDGSDTSQDSTGSGSAADFCNATDPRTVPVDVVVTPEAGEQPYLDALDSAQTSIVVEIYEMGYGGILDALKAKAAAGVHVRVIFDTAQMSVNGKYQTMLAAAGA